MELNHRILIVEEPQFIAASTNVNPTIGRLNTFVGIIKRVESNGVIITLDNGYDILFERLERKGVYRFQGLNYVFLDIVDYEDLVMGKLSPP